MITKRRVMQQQANGLKSLQDSSGLWHTVVNRSDFYLETSATALIAYAFKEGVKHGWLDELTYTPIANAAMVAVWSQVALDGTVNNVSTSTWPMSEDEYNNLTYHELQLYGQGVGLLAGY